MVADVAGKSIPAALLTATLQASLRTLAALPGTLPELVERVNRYSCEQSLQGRRFTTAFLAELEPATGRTDLCQRGPQLAGAAARLRRHRAPGSRRPAAGHQPNAILSMRHARPLEAGGLLLIFTDGLVEAEDDGEREYGEERMLPVMQTLHSGTAKESLQRIMSSVDAFVGLTRQHDDITCLVLRKT